MSANPDPAAAADPDLARFLQDRYGGLLVRDPDSPMGWRPWTDADAADLERWARAAYAGDRLPRLAYSPREAAQVLGVGVSLLKERLHQDAIPHRRLGKRLLIPHAALAQWLQGPPPSDPEKSQEE